jgi:hypothetical protein
MKKNMVTRRVDSLLILRENRETPTDEEWDYCLELLSTFAPNFSEVKVLVMTAGGGPSTAQRARLSRVAQGHPLRVAVVSESTKVRFIVSSVALFLRDISSFRESEILEAYDHLRMTPSEQLLADRALEEMREEVAMFGLPVFPRR